MATSARTSQTIEPMISELKDVGVRPKSGGHRFLKLWPKNVELDNQRFIEYVLALTDGVTGRIIDLLRRAAVDALGHKSKSVGIDQLLIAGAHLPAIINQRDCEFRNSCQFVSNVVTAPIFTATVQRLTKCAHGDIFCASANCHYMASEVRIGIIATVAVPMSRSQQTLYFPDFRGGAFSIITVIFGNRVTDTNS